MKDEARPAETHEHLHARITLGQMGEIIKDRLRNFDDSVEIRGVLRGLLRQIEFLQKQHGYGGYGEKTQ